MRLTVKTKIWMTVITIVLLFAGFVLFYLPAIQERYLLSNYNHEIQSQANTVALGVKIAMTEQNFEGVQTAMDFVKNDQYLKFVSLVQIDTVRTANRSGYTLNKTIFKTYPENAAISVDASSSDSVVVKRAPFDTPTMSGEIIVASSTDEIAESKRQIRGTSLFFSFLVFAIGIGIGFGLARNISVPVLALRDAARNVGLGDLTQRVSPQSRDEIGELGLAFNKMVNDLYVARTEADERASDLIQEKKKSDDLLVDLQNTLVNLKDTQEQLIRQEKLASIGQLTKGLVDRLLNPLNYINNFSAISEELVTDAKEALATEAYATDEVVQGDVLPLLNMTHSNVGKIREHGTNLSRTVRSMEKLLKATSTKFMATNLTTLVEKQVDRVRQVAKQEYADLAVRFLMDFSPDNQPVNLLPVEMESVIGHLFDNALYAVREKSLSATDYTPTLSIKTLFSDGLVDLRIEDNGKGIPAGEIKQLFSPFFTTKPTAKGTGLGLFISQDIVRMHKGSITVDTKEGEYTAFTIQLPIA